jgi:hypothetical protein
VGPITALKAMTIRPACRIFDEGTKGSLEVGKLADFVILSKDPPKVEPGTIADIQVTARARTGPARWTAARCCDSTSCWCAPKASTSSAWAWSANRSRCTVRGSLR